MKYLLKTVVPTSGELRPDRERQLVLEALDTASLASSSSSLQHRVRLTSSQWAGLCVDRV